MADEMKETVKPFSWKKIGMIAGIVGACLLVSWGVFNHQYSRDFSLRWKVRKLRFKLASAPGQLWKNFKSPIKGDTSIMDKIHEQRLREMGASMTFANKKQKQVVDRMQQMQTQGMEGIPGEEKDPESEEGQE